jgi:hypothetical protein
MINRFKSSAAIFAATVILTGCGSSSSSSKGGSTLPGSTAGFPGGTVEANYLADDGKAFSNAGQEVLLPLTVSWNRSNNNAIGVFGTTAGTYLVGQNPLILYYAWFDGTAWHKPVEVHGQNEDADGPLGVTNLEILWLNTTGSADQNTLARNGDAIILFSREDVAPIASSIDIDSNMRLYGTYFDVSEANSVGSGTIQGGFDTLARVLDHDNQIVATNVALGGVDPGVTGVAFASDSLYGSHGLGAGTVIDSGDPTTFVHILYRKDASSGDPTAAQVVGERWWSIPFNLAQVGNALPTATPSNVLPLATGLDTANTPEDVSAGVTVHNGHVFTTVPVASDIALMAYAFNTAAAPTVFEVNSTRGTASDEASLPLAANTYGADHGLASTMFFFEENGFFGLGVAGSRHGNRDHMLGELRVAAGVSTPSAPIDIDGWQGLMDATDGDGDLAVIRTGTTAGSVDAGGLQTRINRSGTAIVAIWLQQNSDLTDLDDGSNTVGTHQPNRIPFVTAVQTRTDAADARTLSASIAAVGSLVGLPSPAFQSNRTTGPVSGTQQDNVGDLRFQEGLAGGQATSQANLLIGGGDDAGALNGLPCDRGATFQGNHLRINFIYTQGSDTAAVDSNNTVLYVNGVTVTLGTGPTVPPSITLTNTTTVAAQVEELDDQYFASLSGARAVDAGDASGTAGAGRVLVFFQSNENDPLAPTASSFDEVRLFVREQSSGGTMGPRTLVSSNPAASFVPEAQQLFSMQGLMVVPVNENTVTSPNHVGERIHLYWVEERNVLGSVGSAALRLATRSYSQTATTATTPVALGDRFVPVLPTTPGTGTPTFIDVPSSGDVLIFSGALIGGRNGSVAGVFFDEDSHLYYTETGSTGAAYPTDLGAPDPALVDNDQSFAIDLIDYYVVFPPVANNLSRCQAVFQRFDSFGSTSFSGLPGHFGLMRLFVRSHN